MADGWRPVHTERLAEKNQNQPPTMKKKKVAKGNKRQEGIELKSPENAGSEFREFLREAIQEAMWNVMREEVESLCGSSHHPEAGAKYRRAGSEEGIMYFHGRKAGLKRPRVRARQADGREREVVLKSYEEARKKKNIEAEIMSFIEEGLSMRSAERVSGKAMSSSEISRMFIEQSSRRLEELRSRDLSEDEYYGMMIDGVFMSREQMVVVALGLRRDGSKQILDFQTGSTESYEVVKDLLSRLKARGFKVGGRLYAVLDGAKALHKGVVEFWPDAVIQDCVIHKERNLYCYLRKTDHAECKRLMKRLRVAEGAVAAREALEEMRGFLKARNAQALASLEEAGERLIALQLLNVPATLNVSLLSTNLIENALLNYRRQTTRVTRWNPKSDQLERWSATALIWVERGFRKIKGHEDIGRLMEALKQPPSAPLTRSAARCVPASPLRGAPAAQETASTQRAAEVNSSVDSKSNPLYASI